MGLLKVRTIALYWISIDPILLDYAISEILYFKHKVTFPRIFSATVQILLATLTLINVAIAMI